MPTTTPTAAQLAHRFALLLKDDIGEANFAEVLRRNRTDEYRDKCACASHDFCDANMVMEAAWNSFGLPDMWFQSSPDKYVDPADTVNAKFGSLWMTAWDLFAGGCTCNGKEVI